MPRSEWACPIHPCPHLLGCQVRRHIQQPSFSLHTKVRQHALLAALPASCNAAAGCICFRQCADACPLPRVHAHAGESS